MASIFGKLSIHIVLLLPCAVNVLPVMGSEPFQDMSIKSNARFRKQTISVDADDRNTATLPPCATSKSALDSSHHHSRHPRDTDGILHDFGKIHRAVYFTGEKKVLTLREASRNKMKKNIPFKSFTIEIWIKPDGGQQSSVPIIELTDICGSETEVRGWSVGIDTVSKMEDNDPRFYFSLRTDRSQIVTTVRGNRRYDAGRWTYITALYTGTKMKLFINGAMVGVGTKQIGDLFDVDVQRCKEIKLGGRSTSNLFFRGYVGRIHLWNVSLTHSDILRHSKGHFSDVQKLSDDLIFQEEFISLDKWIPQNSKKPPSIYEIKSTPPHDLHLAAPPCGKTVCDDPDVVISYLSEANLKLNKSIRYRVINIMNDNGSNPIVSESQILLQHEALLKAFQPYNISWQLSIENVTNSFLWNRLILFGCDSSNIGDGKCDSECQTPMTGNDGGDCDTITLPCQRSSIGNGVCDFECNRAYHHWDGGDCCIDGPLVHRTCFDPTHHLRAYLSVEDYREALGYNSSSYLNIYFATWTVKELIGLATFPWEKNLYTVQGGTIVQPENYGLVGNTDSLIHEFGHNLGLWHIHHGVSEMDCNDKCLETHPSLTLGDLCSDTVPTPHNTHCRDPDVSKTMCGIRHYTNTSYTNYMGYADDECTDNFSPQQVARMHCYLDLVYQPWRISERPSPVPLKPKILQTTIVSVTFGWLPPLGSSTLGNSAICASCSPDGAYSQYASSATSRRKKEDRSPEEAVGPPDADRCKGSTRVWIPDAYHCLNQCFLELYFEEPVVPRKLTIWITWNARDGLDDVVLYLEDGSTYSVGMLPAFCDIPVTQDIHVNKQVYKIRIFTSTPFVGIDAVQIISKPGHVSCDKCKPMGYQVSRTPPFETNYNAVTKSTHFTDSRLVSGTTYTYQVLTMVDGETGPPSPALSYTHGEAYCGDGLLSSEEECDDGNASDGDGCDLTCHVEEFFHCKGEPSLCYIHDGDGICEEFEKSYSVKDCGFYTPKGFLDQWANSAIATPGSSSQLCPEAVVTGTPPIGQGCVRSPDPRDAWTPCGNILKEEPFWIKVYFDRSVVATEVIVYFASDGKTQADPKVKVIQVFLITESNDVRPIGDELTSLNCHNNPLHVTVQHDLSKPFQKTAGVMLKFASANIAISGVRLRSSYFLDPVTLEKCSSSDVYDVHRGRCVSSTCSQSSCKAPKVSSGQFTCAGKSEGDVCKARCHKGFRLRRTDSMIRCVSGDWEGLDSIECIPVDCGWPVIPHASVVCQRGTSYNNQCIFKCKRPARIQGKITTVVCEADGLWSMARSRCRVKCRSPATPPNASIASKSCKNGKHDVGKRCKFRCNKGYHVEGRSRKRRVIKIRCEEDGRWMGPHCVPDICPPLDPIYNGLFQCSKEFRVGSQCYLSCPDDRYNQQKITCQPNGEWDSSFTMCRFSSKSHCPPLKANENGLIIKCTGSEPGSTCEARCRYPHLYIVTNQNTENRPPRDSVLILTCTGKRHWFPNIEGISCVESCNMDFVGDGWCDGKNNRAQCLWDGGDCCSSTMDGRQVQPFPESCASECTCKDPDALENKGYSHTSNRSKTMKDGNRDAEESIKTT